MKDLAVGIIGNIIGLLIAVAFPLFFPRLANNKQKQKTSFLILFFCIAASIPIAGIYYSYTTMALSKAFVINICLNFFALLWIIMGSINVAKGVSEINSLKKIIQDFKDKKI